MQLHHGTVTAASAGPGRGAEFVVHLPQLVDGPASEREIESIPTEGGARLTGVDVLVVDDNDDALDVVSTALTAGGAHVRVARSGEEAINEWGSRPAAILVCDLAMPAMDGFEVLRRIRALDSARGTQTFAIALTAYASPDYRTRTRDAGFDAHLSKPFDPAALLDQIAAAPSTPKSSGDRTAPQ